MWRRLWHHRGRAPGKWGGATRGDGGLKHSADRGATRGLGRHLGRGLGAQAGSPPCPVPRRRQEASEPSPGLGPAGRPWGALSWREATLSDGGCCLPMAALSDGGRCLPEAQDGKGPVGASAQAPNHPDDPPSALPEAMHLRSSRQGLPSPPPPAGPLLSRQPGLPPPAQREAVPV